MPPPRPISRGQGNQLYPTNRPDGPEARGQTVPYDINGGPQVAAPGALNMSIIDLTIADVTEPLFRFRLTRDLVFTGGVADSEIAASGSPVFDIRKDGASVGGVTFSGTAGAVSFGDSMFPSGSLFELYPPSPADGLLDRVSITLST